MSLQLAGFGTALPPHRFGQDELAQLHASFCSIDAERDRILKVLYRRSGVRTRGSVILERDDGPLGARQSFYRPARDEADRGPATAERMDVYAREAPKLALTAAGKALEDAAVEPTDVTHLVTVSCTGFVAPGIDATIIRTLGLPETTQRTHVGFMGCHGALNGLRVAHSMAGAGPDRVALVCAVELCTLHFSYGWDPDMMVANALFADGAAAVVGRSATGPSEPWQIRGTGACLIPDSADDMTWRIGNHGFRMTLSARVPELIQTHLCDWVIRWLAEYGLGLADVGTWAVHPGGPRIVGSVERSLGIDRCHGEVSRDVLAEHGNMSSATILFILERLKARSAPRPCVALAFGPGLVVEALLIG